MFFRLIQKIEEAEEVPNSIYKGSITLIPKLDTSQKSYRSVPLMNTNAKILKKTPKHLQTESLLRELHTRIKWGLSQECLGGAVQHMKKINQCDISH